MTTIQYKGYEIEAVPQQLAESGKWTTDVLIYRHKPSGVTQRQLSPPDTFKTKEEAIKHCFTFAKLIIDGHYTHFTIEDL